MKKTTCRYLIIIMLLAMMLQLPAAALTGNTSASFSDVNPNEWYGPYLENLDLLMQLGMIKGYPDGTFKPEGTITRAEFMRLLSSYEGMYTTTPSKGIHWAETDWNILNEAGVLEDANIPCTKDALDKDITRYEMALLIKNMLYNVFCEATVELTAPESNIKDYSAMNLSYRGAVEQVYGKGIITGYEDSSFQGDKTLSRIEAAVVMVRLLWGSKRSEVSFATENELAAPTDPNFVSFAIQYRTMSTAERRLALFGNANKSYFTGVSDAAGYMTDVTVPIWRINSKTGVKYSTTTTITVNKVVAKEVELIFQEIFNDPERFPIKSIGGARYSDALRHAWGCAIDINPNENYYIQYSTGYTVGSYWRPYQDPYSITPDGSVVRAFAKYGWGWGGQGWSSGVDYMHFSILSSGG